MLVAGLDCKQWKQRKMKRLKIYLGLPSWLSGKKLACQCSRHGFNPGSGRSPGEGNGNPLQYSCLENPMHRGAWRATIHGVTKVWDMTWVTEQQQQRQVWDLGRIKADSEVFSLRKWVDAFTERGIGLVGRVSKYSLPSLGSPMSSCPLSATF